MRHVTAKSMNDLMRYIWRIVQDFSQSWVGYEAYKARDSTSELLVSLQFIAHNHHRSPTHFKMKIVAVLSVIVTVTSAIDAIIHTNNQWECAGPWIGCLGLNPNVCPREIRYRVTD